MASVELVGRLLVSLAVVLGLMWVIVRRMRSGKTGRRGPGGRNGKLIEVLDRAALTRSASVAVVRVNGQAFVLGVAEQGVTILGETDLAQAQATHEATPRVERTAHRAPRTTHRVVTTAVPATERAAAPAGKASPLAGSALSPQTWRQTVESLRDLTARS